MENETSIGASGDLGGSDIDGRYVLKSKLGEGGMGVVYNAVQLSTSREVAFKIVKVDVGDDARLDRFKQEVEIISNLSHPNIVRVIDTGTIPHHDLLYVVMELIEGITLSDLLWHKHAEGQYFKCRTRVEFALEVAYQLCAALTEPHRQGIIHRDIKPENILISPSSDETVQLKVLDFGIARVLNHSKPQKKMTDSRIPFVGTPHYMAPEQVARSQYDARTDLYAVGVVLFEMLSSQYPFDNDNLLALLLQKTQREAPSLADVLPEDHEVLQDVIALTDTLLARDQESRPADAMKVRRMIEDIRDEHRLRRVRIDVHDFFEQRKRTEKAAKKSSAPDPSEEEAGDDEKLEPYRSIYRSWLLYPSGKPIISTDEEEKEERTVAAQAVAPKTPPAAAVIQPAGLAPVMPAILSPAISPVMPALITPPVVAPENPPSINELAEDSSVSGVEIDAILLAEEGVDSHTDVLKAPKRNKLKAWHVDINWTNSFNVSDINQPSNLDVQEMGELFEEDTKGEELDEIDEVVTAIWKPDLSEFPQDLLDKFRSYDDPPEVTQSERAAAPTEDEGIDEPSGELDSSMLLAQSDAAVDLGMVPPSFASIPGMAKHTPDFGAMPLQLTPSSEVMPPPGSATSREAETVRERALAGHVIGSESYPSNSDTIPEPFSIKTPAIQEMLAEARNLREERGPQEALITTESGLHSLLPEADLSPSRIAKVALFDDDSISPVQPLHDDFSSAVPASSSPSIELMPPSVPVTPAAPVPAPVEQVNDHDTARQPSRRADLSAPVSDLSMTRDEPAAAPSKLPMIIGVLIVLLVIIGVVMSL